MGKKNKLLKFSELSTFPNTYQNYRVDEPLMTDCNGEKVDLKGRWKVAHFKNDHPITLELACGGGEYTLDLARKYPDRNFIGIDIKGNRLWKGARVALAENLDNAAFARMRIEKITSFFGKDEVDKIWITFADPFLKKPNRRLTAPTFLERYREFLKENGTINLKTDSPELYEFTMEVLQEGGYPIEYYDDDIYSKPLAVEELSFKTFYERQHLKAGKTIKYVRFRLS